MQSTPRVALNAVAPQPAAPRPRSPSEVQSEQQRLARAAASRIWQRHRLYLYGLSLRWMRGDRVEAEDAVSDVLYKASVTIGRGTCDIVNERAWLTRVLHNRCMDRHRSRKVEQPLVRNTDATRDDCDDHAAADRSAEELLLNRELGEVIQSALAELPEGLRGPVVMRLLNDETYTAISSEFRISEANARKRIQQAREILRAQLREYLQGSTGGTRLHRVERSKLPSSGNGGS